MLKTIAVIGLGGALGSMLRYSVAVVTEKFLGATIPIATLLINLLGCLLIGVLIAVFDRNILVSPHLKWFLITGFCGGFTTFSAFGNDALILFSTGQPFTAISYVLASVIGGILLVYLGFLLAS